MLVNDWSKWHINCCLQGYTERLHTCLDILPWVYIIMHQLNKAHRLILSVEVVSHRDMTGDYKKLQIMGSMFSWETSTQCECVCGRVSHTLMYSLGGYGSSIMSLSLCLFNPSWYEHSGLSPPDFNSANGLIIYYFYLYIWAFVMPKNRDG